MASNTFDSYYLRPYLWQRDKKREDGLDGKSMGDTGQIYSEAPRPGCQKVLEVNACVGFSSILPKDYGKKDYGKKTGQGEELGESCWHAGKIWPISPGSLKDNVGMAQSRPAYGPAISLHLGKSSPIKACRDYGCVETQGKQWACISGLSAMREG